MSTVLVVLAIPVAYLFVCEVAVPVVARVVFFRRWMLSLLRDRAERTWRDQHAPTQTCGVCGEKAHELSYFRGPMVSRCPACHKKAFPWRVRWWSGSVTRATFTAIRIAWGRRFVHPKTPCAYEPGDFIWFIPTGEILEVGSVFSDYVYTGPCWQVVAKKYPRMTMMEAVLLRSCPGGLTEAQAIENAQRVVAEAKARHEMEA